MREPEQRHPYELGLKSMLKLNSEKPSNKFNKWCEIEPLVCSDQQIIQKAFSHSLNRDLTPSASAVLFLHELTGCMGLEFVAFSNVKTESGILLPNNVMLEPCFFPNTEGLDVSDPLVQMTIKMENEHRFIYDGWIPIKTMDINSINNAIRHIDEALSLFSLISRDSFSWEPKYNLSSSPSSQKSIAYYTNEHIKNIEEISKTLTCLPYQDQAALYRSIAWLAQSTRMAEPAARFLLCILAFESLATHIERNTCGDSPLFILCSEKITKDQRRTKSAACIKDKLETVDLLTLTPNKDMQKARIAAVQNAYFDCIVGIKKMLMKHIDGILGKESEMINTFFIEKIDGYSLYELRNEIAHGSYDTLSDSKTQYISSRIFPAETLVQQYILAVIKKTLNYEVLTRTMMASISLFGKSGIISHRDMYRGPTHMALIYK